VSAPMSNSGVQAAMSILSHVYFAPILGRLIRARVPDLLHGGAVHSAALANKAGLHPLSTVRALRALTAFGVFREVAPCMFVNSEASTLFRDAPGGLRNYALFATSEQFLKSSAALGHSLETGEAAHDHALGQSVWEYMRDHPEDNAAFNRGLAEIRKDEQAAIAAAYDWTGVTTVVDVGAGAGALLASIVAENPGVRGILFDRPDVLPDADHLLTGRGVRERCELVGGSFFEPMHVKGDVWILSQVLHDWPDAQCRTILAQCRARMNSGDRLLVVEMVPVPGQPDVGIAMLDIAMMIFGGEARQRTEAEYNELFAATGFGPARVVGTGTAFSILEVKPD
jgi:O-methyltransferase domain